MRKIEVEELKKIQIQILDVVDTYCRNNKVNYWIDTGTLLGAVRHKGYIPWDDDIDLGMLRKDYEVFVEKFNKSNNRYKCCTMENTYDFPFAFAKVMDTETVLYEPNKEEGIKLSINIDIFVYDNAPDDVEQLKAMYDDRDKNINWYRRRILPKWTSGSKIKKIIRYIFCLLLKIVPRHFFVNKINKNIKQYDETDTGYVGNFTSDSKILCSKEAFDSFIDIEFEGKKYKAPIGYDKWLRAFYGDYMQLPPVEKRVSRHSFEAYVKE